jgi:hypothetical protein
MIARAQDKVVPPNEGSRAVPSVNKLFRGSAIPIIAVSAPATCSSRITTGIN